MDRWSRRGLLTLGAVGALAACSGDPSRTAPTPTGPSGSPSAGTANWSQLRRHVTGSLALPKDPAYDTVRLLENPRYDDNHPLGVLTVSGADDVATALSFAQDSGIPIAIRSGGHSYPGWSGGGGGRTGLPRALVIDCRSLDTVTVDGTTATIGAGAALAPVYAALGTAGRAIAGGSCATVGIAGLTLGGGVGVLTRAMGLTCDAVTSMDVVTADATLRTVDADHDPDLFWALRGGGGGHVGVVTSFVFATQPAPTLGTFFLTWPIASAPEVIAAWQEWAPSADARLWSTLKALGGEKHPDGPTLLLSGTWVGAQSSLDGQLSGLLDQVPAPASRSSDVRSYGEAMASYAGCSNIPVAQCNTGPGGSLTREAFGATSHVAYDVLPAGGITTLLDHVQDAQSSGLLEAGISMDALGGRVQDLAADATAFGHRSALMTVQYTATFGDGVGSAGAADSYVRGFRSAMVPSWGEHAYVNYSDSTLTDFRSAYFADNADRLATVREQYDASGFFTQPQDF
ncbi:FAD-binding oxidoreductase [Nocardioides sp.]|uniref:FAD-binding oxidoreductase n=1 Tax=Nocardioides sp. TaxID=35761 RepID=UPI003D14645B